MSEIKSIYLDNSATTKICDEALKKYNTVSQETYGNPSSLHSLGLMAEKEIKLAREVILSSIGDRDSEIIFTASLYVHVTSSCNQISFICIFAR